MHYLLLNAAAPELGIDVPKTIEVWRHGSVVRSWLLDLLARALAEDPKLEKIAGYAEDSGEGRWTVNDAVFSWWNGQRPMYRYGPDLRSRTCSPTTPTISTDPLTCSAKSMAT